MNQSFENKIAQRINTIKNKFLQNFDANILEFWKKFPAIELWRFFVAANQQRLGVFAAERMEPGYFKALIYDLTLSLQNLPKVYESDSNSSTNTSNQSANSYWDLDGYKKKHIV